MLKPPLTGNVLIKSILRFYNQFVCFYFYIFDIYIIEIDINKCLDGGEVIVSRDIYVIFNGIFFL